MQPHMIKALRLAAAAGAIDPLDDTSPTIGCAHAELETARERGYLCADGRVLTARVCPRCFIDALKYMTSDGFKRAVRA